MSFLFIYKFFYQTQFKFIKFPARNQMRTTAHKFNEKPNFCGIVGAVDGCNIEIDVTSENELADKIIKRHRGKP